jgi:hypothetical protein
MQKKWVDVDRVAHLPQSQEPDNAFTANGEEQDFTRDEKQCDFEPSG